jgi:hypothetical protein
MDVLKANALDFARQIDELRSILVVVPTRRADPEPKRTVPKLAHSKSRLRPSERRRMSTMGQERRTD